MKLNELEKYALLRSVYRKEVAEERSKEDLSIWMVAHIIERNLERVDYDENKLCTKFQAYYKAIIKVAKKASK